MNFSLRVFSKVMALSVITAIVLGASFFNKVPFIYDNKVSAIPVDGIPAPKEVVPEEPAPRTRSKPQPPPAAQSLPQCALDWPNGDRYEGDCIGGEMTGKCIYIWSTGERYQGDCDSGKPNGKGVVNFTNGDQYEGDCVDGKIKEAIPLNKLGLTKLPDGRETWESDGLKIIEVPKGVSVYYWRLNGNRFHINKTGGLIQAIRVLVDEKPVVPLRNIQFRR